MELIVQIENHEPLIRENSVREIFIRKLNFVANGTMRHE